MRINFHSTAADQLLYISLLIFHFFESEISRNKANRLTEAFDHGGREGGGGGGGGGNRPKLARVRLQLCFTLRMCYFSCIIHYRRGRGTKAFEIHLFARWKFPASISICQLFSADSTD